MRLPKPKTSDWVIIFVSVLLLGASAVIGDSASHDLQVWLFWAGAAGLCGLFIWHFVVWVWNLSHSVEKQPISGVDNRGGIYIAGDSRGSHTIIQNNIDAAAQERVHGILTGGESYCYFMLYFFDLNENVARNIVVIRKGEFPLYNVRIRILDMDTKAETVLPIGEMGEIGKNTTAISIPGVWPLRENVYYRIFFHARNGFWHQDLLLKKSPQRGYWLAATKVRKADGTTILEEIDQNFSAEFGLPEWLA